MLKNAAIFAPSDTVGFALRNNINTEYLLLANISEYSHIIAAENIDEIANSTVHLMIHAISHT